MLRILSAQSRELYDLRRDGKLIFRGTANECYMKLQKVQGQSADWAMKHEGYSISPTMEDWRDHLKGPVQQI